MSVEPSTCRFWQVALQSGAIDTAGLRVCWDAIPEPKRVPDAIDRRLARQAVTSGRLTLWQAQQILAGRGFALKIDKYVLMDLIGQGGMGRVYLARDTRLNRKVAIKILSRERMSNPRAMARFEREGKVGAQLQHDNLVRIYDEGDSNGLRYLVMEFIEGRNVAQLLADAGPLPPGAVAIIGRQIALGLEHARLKGLIHRDVNPQNILVTKEGIAKLTDMGLAIDLGDPDDIVTRDGATVGTFDYISPEQARHPREVDARSDIYSLGCSLYHMVAGRPPFPAQSLPEKLYAHQSAEPEPLIGRVDDVPPALDAVIRRMMAKKPDDRYETPAEVARVLGPLVSGPPSLAYLLDWAAQKREAVAAPTLAEPAEVHLPVAEAGLVARSPASSQVPMAPASPRAPATDPELIVEPRATEPEPDPAHDLTKSTGGDFPLQIDLGPDLSLADSLQVSRTRSRSRSGSGTNERDTLPAGESPEDRSEPDPIGNWKRPVLAAGALVVVLGAALLAAWLAGWIPTAPIEDGTTISDGSGDPGTTAGGPSSTATSGDSTTPPTAAESGFFVLRQGETTPEPQPTLQDALNRAAGGRGTVLVGDVPSEIVVDKAATLVPMGQVVIQAAPGRHPVLSVRLRGREPFLRQIEGRLTLRGLTFRVSMDPAVSGVGTLIEANDSLTVDKCSFIEVESKDSDCCAIHSAGNGFEVSNSLFLGFDSAIVLEAYLGSRSVARNSIFVWQKGDAARVPGWVVRAATHVRARPGRPTLAFDRCTVLGAAGLIEAVQLDAEHPVEGKVTGCAILSDHLISRPATSEGEALLIGLDWTGAGNGFDLQKAAWIVNDRQGLATPVGSPSDLSSWRELVGDREAADSRQQILQLGDPTAMTSGSTDPASYRLDVPQGEAPVGADPSKVGPPAVTP